eukprot:3570262-Amphidinium_carterae.1
MSTFGRPSLTHYERALLLQCASLWPDSMVDKGSFIKMLLHVLDVEAETDNRSERWEKEVTASGACNASVVHVKHFVAFCLQGGVETMLGVLSRPQPEHKRLAAPSGPLIERLDAVNTKPGGPSHPSGGGMSSSSWTLSAAVIGGQIPLPSPEAQAGALVVVDSKHYVLGERLGRGGGGSVFAATLKH